MEDMVADVSTFTNQRITFEFRVANARQTDSYSFIDVIVGDTRTCLRIEYKWLSTNTVPQATFISQFIERDLFSAPSLASLQWRIKDKKLDLATVKAYMESQEERDALSPLLESGKLQELYPDPIVINDIDDFILEFTKELNFNAIFK